MPPIHIPYDPDQQIGEFGWLWLTDGPMGPEWHLVQTIEEDGYDDSNLLIWFVGDGDGHTSDCAPANRHKGAPYLPILSPSCEPGKADALEVTVRFDNGASAATAHGASDRTEAVREAVCALILRPRNDAALDVLAERRRQIEAEGFTADHDDRHIRGELATAAACYAAPSRYRLAALDLLWPPMWSGTLWKPSGAHDDLTARRRDLVKAAALILAEIERLDRTGDRHEGDRPHD